jgi:Uma2 family endonuclease
MSSAVRSVDYTFEDFCAVIPDKAKADLIDGVIYMASPDNLEADDIGGWVYTVVRVFSRSRDVGRAFGSRVAFRLDARNSPEPDIGFVKKARLHLLRKGHVQGGPDAAFEVVSPESVDRDYGKKFRQYESARVLEYWIIDEPERKVLLYRLGRDGKYKQVRPRDGKLESKVIEGFYLRPEWLFGDQLADERDALAELLGWEVK